MENASKALIIAGAILLSILIIGLGMFIYTQAQGATEGANLDPQKAQAYNQEFLQYKGTISGTNARALYDVIASHNRVNTGDVSRQILLTIVTGGNDFQDQVEADHAGNNDLTMPQNTLKSGRTYVASFKYNKSGYIIKCQIRQK